MDPDLTALLIAVAGSLGAYARKALNRHEVTNAQVTWWHVVITGPMLAGSGMVSITTPVMTVFAAFLMGAGVSSLGGMLVGRGQQMVDRVRNGR
jgi:hypothetical protein